MNSILTKTLKTIEWFIFIALLAIAVVVLSPFLPTKNHFATFIVGSGSMEPKIKTGSIAVISAQNLNDVGVGDVISFTSPNDPDQTIIHRVVRKNEGNIYVTKGDNNPVEDQWTVSQSMIKGKYQTSIPYLGYLAIYMKEPKNFALIVGIPFAIFCTLQIIKIKNGIHEEIEKRTQAALQKHESVKKVTTISDV